MILCCFEMVFSAMQCLGQGFDVFYLDFDTVLLQDPLPSLKSRMDLAETQLLLSRDFGTECLNTGVIFAKSHPLTVAFWERHHCAFRVVSFFDSWRVQEISNWSCWSNVGWTDKRVFVASCWFQWQFNGKGLRRSFMGICSSSLIYSYHLVVGAYVVATREGLISEPWPLAGCVTSVSSPCYVDQSDQWWMISCNILSSMSMFCLFPTSARLLSNYTEIY